MQKALARMPDFRDLGVELVLVAALASARLLATVQAPPFCDSCGIRTQPP